MPIKKHSEQICWSIKNKKSVERCTRHALAGSEYCGYHNKNPTRFVPVTVTATTATAVTATPLPPCSNTQHVQHIQRMWRQHQVALRGPALYARELANNKEDFCSFEPIETIPHHYFFSYLAADRFVYAFDMRSLFCLVDSSAEMPQNPYNRQNLPSHVLEKLAVLRRRAMCFGLSTTHEAPETTPEIAIRQEALDIFQQIDRLDFYTDLRWFTSMDIGALQIFYRELATVFMARSELTWEQQRAIVPTNPFVTSISEVGQMVDMWQIQKLILDSMRTMITSSPEHNNRKLGALYIMMALVRVNKRAARAYPWLL